MVGDTRGGNWGCHFSIFFWKKLCDLFAHQSSLSLFIDFTRVSPLEGVTQHLFYLSDLVSPLFFVNFPTKIFSFGVTPLEGVTRGGPPPSPPPSDATGFGQSSRLNDNEQSTHRSTLIVRAAHVSDADARAFESHDRSYTIVRMLSCDCTTCRVTSLTTSLKTVAYGNDRS